MKKTRILITGGRGFIGSHLVPLLQKDYEVATWDIKDKRDVFDLTIEHFMNIDIVIHLAALTDVRDSFASNERYFWINMMGTAHIAEFCLRTNTKMVYMSSAAIADPKSSPYAESKYYAHKIVDKLFSSLKPIMLTLYNVYGAGMSQESVLYRFIHNDSITVYGDGSHTRDFINVADVCLITKYMIDENMDSINVAVGTGKATKISTLVNFITKITKKPVVYMEGMPEVVHSKADTKELQDIYPHDLVTDVKKDIERMIRALN